MDDRAAGILLHPTALPGELGSGDLGAEASAFLAWAESAGQRLWQVLPLGPTHGSGSPYGAPSAFAGNPLLISPRRLADAGLLAAEELAPASAEEARRVDFARVGPRREKLLRSAWSTFARRASEEQRRAFDDFRAHPDQRFWLDDWTLFAALRRAHGETGWWSWPEPLARRDPAALDNARREHADEIAYQAFVQHLFFAQWRALRDEARERGVRIVGDLPIYVALDGADAWAHPDLFELGDDGQPLAVAGVPPDYFSPTGQRWGNPLYRWRRHAETGYAWWIERVRANLRLTDLVRLDHFRGFAGYWRVPAEHPTAEHGEWVPGPGAELFAALAAALAADGAGDSDGPGALPLIAEDLGEITPDVEALRAHAGLPGMHVLHFGFDDPASPHAPHRHRRRGVVYTGTHDNDTTLGWYRALPATERQRVDLYTGAGEPTIARALVRLAYTSVAETAIVPAQDLLALGADARFNTPGEPDGNWSWRLAPGELTPELAADLRRLAEISGR